MSQQMYSIALKNALTEIRNICPDINWAFILMNNGIVIAEDEQATDPTIEKVAGFFQTLAEEAMPVGGLDNLLIDAEKGRVYVSRVNGMYLIAGLNKQADFPYFRNVTQVILPAIIRVLDNITSLPMNPTPLKPSPLEPNIPSEPIPSKQTTEKIEEVEEFEPPKRLESPEAIEAESEKKPSELTSQQLIVDSMANSMTDRLRGLLTRSSVQIDEQILKRWSKFLDLEKISEVEIETLNGKTVRCKTKIIDDPQLQSRGLIRIPERTCQALEVKGGELVRVKPVVPED